MKIRRRNRRRMIIFGLALFIAAFALVYVGIRFFTGAGIFHKPGVVYYEEGLDEDQLDILRGIFTDEVILKSDVHISTYSTAEKPELMNDEYIYNIMVPVTDYYDTRVDSSEFDNVDMIPLDELDFTKKLLSLNGKYYLDDSSKGAYFQIVKFNSERFSEEIAPLVDSSFNRDWPDSTNILTFAQTGVTAMSRGMYAKLNATGGDATFFSSQIKDYLSKFDLTHTSNEASFTASATADNICSDPRFLDTLLDIGLDIVELTGNHNLDCGIDAALDTIDLYNKNNIEVVGGGRTAGDAAIPLKINQKGTNITFLAYNLSTGGATYDDTPGANQYYEENAIEEINAAKDRGDVVIVDIQYYECSAYDSTAEDTTCDYADSAAGDQIGFFHHLIDLGADVVVGTSAHQPQTFELYGGGAIYYGLGNLFFDQYWWPGTTRSLILEHYFYNGKLLQTHITPTVYDSNMQPKLMDVDDMKWYIGRLIKARP
ncbi:MAG: CapA family protein [Candidatus Saccharimonadaceae bacterium]|nr:CapA family protein [Candidatus Saccharimonadaceae bacterium]